MALSRLTSPISAAAGNRDRHGRRTTGLQGRPERVAERLASGPFRRPVPAGAARRQEFRRRDQAGAQHRPFHAGAHAAGQGAGGGEDLRAREVRIEIPLRNGFAYSSTTPARALGGEGREPQCTAPPHRQGHVARMAPGFCADDAGPGHLCECDATSRPGA